jgi:divalent metal cation (Fe/Co/Zn/Cd) transporter
VADGTAVKERASEQEAGTERGPASTLAALCANIGVALAKFVAWAFTGSASMLAEAIHSVADITNQGLLLVGRHQSRRSETRQHPLGSGRER